MDFALIIYMSLGGRMRSLCCKVAKPPPPPPRTVTCNITTCHLDPSECDIAVGGWGAKKRDDGSSHSLDIRGPPRPYKWTTITGLVMLQYSLSYPTPMNYMEYLRRAVPGIVNRWYQMLSRSCSDPSLRATRFNNLLVPPPEAQVEHIIPVSN